MLNGNKDFPGAVGLAQVLSEEYATSFAGTSLQLFDEVGGHLSAREEAQLKMITLGKNASWRPRYTNTFIDHFIHMVAVLTSVTEINFSTDEIANRVIRVNFEPRTGLDNNPYTATSNELLQADLLNALQLTLEHWDTSAKVFDRLALTHLIAKALDASGAGFDYAKFLATIEADKESDIEAITEDSILSLIPIFARTIVTGTMTAATSMAEGWGKIEDIDGVRYFSCNATELSWAMSQWLKSNQAKVVLSQYVVDIVSSPQRLSTQLRRNVAALNRLGIDIQFTASHGKRLIKFSYRLS